MRWHAAKTRSACRDRRSVTIRPLAGEANADSAVERDLDGGRYDRNAVLAGEIGTLGDVDRDHTTTFIGEPAFELPAVRAERMGELDDKLLRRRGR